MKHYTKLHRFTYSTEKIFIDTHFICATKPEIAAQICMLVLAVPQVIAVVTPQQGGEQRGLGLGISS